MPAVSSTSECQHVVDRNLVAGIRCRETHRLQSLARGGAGAYTRIFQTLDLVSIYDPSASRPQYTEAGETESGTGENDEESLPAVSHTLHPIFTDVISRTQMDVVKRESLQFRHDLRQARAPNDYTTAKDALQKFCSSMKVKLYITLHPLAFYYTSVLPTIPLLWIFKKYKCHYKVHEILPAVWKYFMIQIHTSGYPDTSIQLQFLLLSFFHKNQRRKIKKKLLRNLQK